MHAILRSLSSGDRRSIGRSNRAAAAVLHRPQLLAILFQGLETNNPVLRMRCADAIEKATLKHPALLIPYKNTIIKKYTRIQQKEVRWHVVLLLARLPLTARQATGIVQFLLTLTHDPSSIVKTMTMQAMTDIALHHPHLLPSVTTHIQQLTATATPAMKARSKKLLKLLAQADNTSPATSKNEPNLT